MRKYIPLIRYIVLYIYISDGMQKYLIFCFVYFQFYLVMKGQGLANDTTERSKNGPGKFVASKVKASSQAAVTAAVGPGQSSATQQPASNNVPISSIGLSENSKLSEKDIQVCIIE